eukprot:5444833-Pyramimonas_sp.AAC.1
MPPLRCKFWGSSKSRDVAARYHRVAAHGWGVRRRFDDSPPPLQLDRRKTPRAMGSRSFAASESIRKGGSSRPIRRSLASENVDIAGTILPRRARHPPQMGTSCA